jgi:hypothetical protein
MPCERVFFSGNITATDWHARLKVAIFKELQILNAAWQSDVVNLLKINSDLVEELTDQDFKDMVIADDELAQWDCGEFGSFT